MNCDSNWIDNQALMLESVFIGETRSKITTTHGTYYSKMTVLDLLNKACIRYASTLEGRIQGTRAFMNYPKKTPILIDPAEIGAFPTMSIKNLECIWLFNHHFIVEGLGKQKSKITFRNGTAITVDVSKHVLVKQQHRLLFTLETYRIIQREKKPYLLHQYLIHPPKKQE